MTRRLRIFLSSPGDVSEERLRANLVIQKLARDYVRFFKIEPYLWEHEPMMASGHFQDAIEPPSSSDIVILIVYSRLGTSLPEKTTVRAYQGIDGRAPVTGTEWEFEEALAAFRASGAPDLLAYRKVGDPGTSLVDAARRVEQERQWTALEAFWRRHFEDSGLFLAGSARFETLEEFDAKLENDLVRLIERRIAQASEEDQAAVQQTWLRGSPFRGLATYEFEDAPIFFGRDGQIRAAATRLQAAAERGTAFLLVLGASGAGKSSLARAGILPMLFAPKAVPGVGLWRRVIMRPGEGGDPIAALARALAAGNPAAGVGLPEILSSGLRVETLIDHLVAAPDDPSFPFRVALDRVRDEGRKRGLLPHESARLVILVDQLEELFTAQIEPERRDLFARIVAGLARSGVVWVVGTIRNDLWHRAAETPALLRLVEAGARMDLLRPDNSEIIEILRRPAASAGLQFEVDSERGVGLDAVIAASASEEPGVLPLLSVLLETLYERDVAAAPAAGARTLTFATYRDLGELNGAVASRADQVLTGLAETDPEAAASLPNVLRALVVARTSRDAVTSRPARMDSFAAGGPEARLVARFLAPEARLLVASEGVGGAEIRLAHEALLTHWPTARNQIETDRRDLETRGRVEALHHRWEQAANRREKADALLTGLNLVEAVDLARRWNIKPGSPLGDFIASSHRAESWRRRRTVVIAAGLVLVFAVIAALAGLQWKRAEQQAEIARRAEETERQARAVSEQQTAEALRQKERADAERARALDAVDVARMENVRTLVTQSERAIIDHDVRRALSLAVQAGETERSVREQLPTPVSEPALLGSLAEAREEFHVQRPSAKWLFPHHFVGKHRLAYGDPEAGLVVVELLPEAHILSRTALPPDFSPTHIRGIGNEGLIAVSGGDRLLVVDPQSGAIQVDRSFSGRVNAIDVDLAGQTVAVAAGTQVALVGLGGGEPVHIEIPGAGPNRLVGQVRFEKSGKQLFASAGTSLVRYDLESRAFLPSPIAELTSGKVSYEQAEFDELLGLGLLPIAEWKPDLIDDRRLLVRTELDLRAIDIATGAVTTYAEDSRGLFFAGTDFVDQAATGSLQEAVAITYRRNENDIDFQLSYISESDGKPVLLEFQDISIANGDLAGEKPWSCQVAPTLRHMACQYWGTTLQGLVVWSLFRGAHPFEQVAAAGAGMSPRLTSGLAVPGSPSRLLATRADGGLVAYADGQETRLAELAPEWRLSSFQDPYVAAVEPASGQVQVWRWDKEAGAVNPVLGPSPGSAIRLAPASNRAAIVAPSGLSLVDLDIAATLWTVPGVGAPRGMAVSPDGARIGVVTQASVQVFDGASGRLLASQPIDAAEGAPVALDGKAERVAFLAGDGATKIVTLSSGEERMAPKSDRPAQALAWSGDGDRLYVGGRDGAVTAVDPTGAALWTSPSPLGRPSNEALAWPDQPPRGAVLQIAPSRDGQRFAVVRQEVATLDIYDTAAGRHLTRLTPPWNYGVPSEASFAFDDFILSHWAVHGLARAQPGYVAIHRLPPDFASAISAAQHRLKRLTGIWSPAGPPGATPAEPQAN